MQQSINFRWILYEHLAFQVLSEGLFIDIHPLFEPFVRDTSPWFEKSPQLAPEKFVSCISCYSALSLLNFGIVKPWLPDHSHLIGVLFHREEASHCTLLVFLVLEEILDVVILELNRSIHLMYLVVPSTWVLIEIFLVFAHIWSPLGSVFCNQSLLELFEQSVIIHLKCLHWTCSLNQGDWSTHDCNTGDLGDIRLMSLFRRITLGARMLLQEMSSFLVELLPFRPNMLRHDFMHLANCTRWTSIIVWFFWVFENSTSFLFICSFSEMPFETQLRPYTYAKVWFEIIVWWSFSLFQVNCFNNVTLSFLDA